MRQNTHIWFNGKICTLNNAQISVLSHSLHYGTGVFEGIRCYKTTNGSAIFRLDDHIDRLFYSASCVRIKMPYTKKQFKDAIKTVILKNKITDGYIRPIIFYGTKHLSINPEGCRVNCVIAAWPWKAYLGTKPIKTIISSFRRIHPQSTYIDAKICGHYVNSMLATLQAREAGCSEAIMLDYKGYVAEGSGENIFIVKKGQLYTPSAGNILRGITRASILEIAQKIGIKCIEKKITVKELLTANEAFFTGTAAEIAPIGIINGKTIGNGETGPITKLLAGHYKKIVHGQSKTFPHWLTQIQ